MEEEKLTQEQLEFFNVQNNLSKEEWEEILKNVKQ